MRFLGFGQSTTKKLMFLRGFVDEGFFIPPVHPIELRPHRKCEAEPLVPCGESARIVCAWHSAVVIAD